MFIYKIINIINSKTYIGQTIQTLEKRWSAHKGDCKRRDYPLHNAFKKYGMENFTFECVETLPEGSTIDDLNNREIYWIKTLNTMCPNGYNLKEGGANGSPSAETKRKLSLACMGKPSWIKGKKHSKETLAKMSAAKKGKIKSKETKAKMSFAKKGVAVSEETKAKLSAINIGKRHSNEAKAKISAAGKGRKHTEESIAKMREAKVKRDLLQKEAKNVEIGQS